MKPKLFLTPRYTQDSIALWKAGIALDWEVERLQSRTQSPDFASQEIAVYGEPFFVTSVAAALKHVLLEPPFHWLTTLPIELTKRVIQYTTLDKARQLPSPSFVKPADDKCFDARVYAHGSDLPTEDELDGSIPVLISEPVTWNTEYRCFILDREVQTLSIYLRFGELAQSANGEWPQTEFEIRDALTFANMVLNTANVALPPAVVLDIGTIDQKEWAVVEANPAWASGIYGCEPEKVLSVISRACVAEEQLLDKDRPWIIQQR